MIFPCSCGDLLSWPRPPPPDAGRALQVVPAGGVQRALGSEGEHRGLWKARASRAATEPLHMCQPCPHSRPLAHWGSRGPEMGIALQGHMSGLGTPQGLLSPICGSLSGFFSGMGKELLVHLWEEMGGMRRAGCSGSPNLGSWTCQHRRREKSSPHTLARAPEAPTTQSTCRRVVGTVEGILSP